MGRKSQENMTRKTFEERREAAKRFSMLDVIRRIRESRQTEKDPFSRANTNRDGKREI